jgi:hypothetical protein
MSVPIRICPEEEGENSHFVTEETALISSSLKSRGNSFWLNPWLFSVATTLVALLPALLLATVFTYELTGRLWPATFLSLHISLALGSACLQLAVTPSCPDSIMTRSSRGITSLGSIVDIVLCHKIYPSLASSFDFMFQDIDGTPVDEWRSTSLLLQTSRAGFHLVVWSRLVVGGATWLRIICRSSPRRNRLIEQGDCNYTVPKIVRFRLDEFGKYVEMHLPMSQSELKSQLLRVVKLFGVLSLLWLAFGVQACVSHLTDWPGLGAWNLDGVVLGNRSNACCDILDPTDCALPFPSFHHMVRDNTTKTGWRVSLHSDSLPFLRGGIPLDPGFWNELDGFSTMAPILFYGLDGLKEGHMANRHGAKTNVYPRLVDDNVRESITHQSITLLWDVDQSKLIAHTAQFDDLDPLLPLIMMVPAQPLHHATHYAVAVINATDVHGERIPQTMGMKSLFEDLDTTTSGATCVRDGGRVDRYQSVLLASLQRAAPWLAADPLGLADGSIQLMFDFVTMSRDSLRTIERVRDATLEAVSSWDSHQVEVVRIEDHDCSDNTALVARTVHGSIRVPWFLESPSRSAVLSKSLLPFNGARLPESRAKFVVRIPCCLKAAAIGWNDTTFRAGKPLRAIIEYGHGLFFNRAESYDQALSLVAEDHGYIVMAMDWRGMSSFDLPVVMKTLLGQPKLFQATRDNLYQGYANKIVLQHYANSAMLNATWLRFSETHRRRSPTFPIPLLGGIDAKPTSVFYGSSQGGILGAGYTKLLGETGLIARGVLGVPGTSFSLVLSRTADFAAYDSLLLRNFYRNRQVRLILSIVQLGWDPVEAAGLLAPPVKPGSFPPMLLQSGLGDPVVPTIATEALARAYNASILPNNPRTEIFGISMVEPSAASNSHVVWTELLYEKEYQQLPFDNIFSDENTILVHACVRQDCALMAQLAEFVNSGRIIDPCIHDGCLRTNISCYMPWMNIETKPRNWKCSGCSSTDNHTHKSDFSIDGATCNAS